MKRGWAVLWTGRSCTAFLDAKGEWTLDPDEARVFRSWVQAKTTAALIWERDITIGRCWYEDEDYERGLDAT